jgi:predicted molibdopterin-dependent oxidoreductase YjgC
VPFLVVQTVSLGEYADYADAVLPAAAFLEKDGHLTDWEGRGQRIRPVRDPGGLSRPDWQIFQELSEVMEADMGFTSLEDLHREMGPLVAPRDLGPEPTPSQRGEREEAGRGLLLFSYSLLVDQGLQSVDAEELKAALAQGPFLEIHPDDAERLGLADGAPAVLRTEAGEVELPVRVTEGIAAGVAFVPWNQAGFRANSLFRGRPRIAATLEAVAKEEVPA